MIENRIPIVQRISQSVRKGALVDVYALSTELQREFPQVPEKELSRVVSEEVIKSNCNAVWDRRGG